MGGLARVNGWKRTSLIVDPDNGRIPSIATEEQREKAHPPGGFGSVKDRELDERCLHVIGTPIKPNVVFRDFEIVQTPNHVMIMAELLHEVRIIRIGSQHVSPGVRQWLGDSIGHWDGDTLVIDTIGIDERTWNDYVGWFHSDQEHVVERLTRPSTNYLYYQVTIDDPKVLTKPWTSAPHAYTLGHEPLQEYYCTNNHELEGLKQLRDLTEGTHK